LVKYFIQAIPKFRFCFITSAEAIKIQTLCNPDFLKVQLKAVTYPNPKTEYFVLKMTDTAIENLE